MKTGGYEGKRGGRVTANPWKRFQLLAFESLCTIVRLVKLNRENTARKKLAGDSLSHPVEAGQVNRAVAGNEPPAVLKINQFRGCKAKSLGPRESLRIRTIPFDV
jgi:hypothetical protein